jgi:hypothetical protein
MELADIVFRLKKQLGVRLSKQDRDSLMLGRTPPDLSIGALHGLVCMKLVEAGRWGEFEPRLEGDWPCRICAYNLRGLRRGGRCPECGTGVEAHDQIWALVCQVVTDATGVEESKIGRASMLYRDLVK